MAYDEWFVFINGSAIVRIFKPDPTSFKQKKKKIDLEMYLLYIFNQLI